MFVRENGTEGDNLVAQLVKSPPLMQETLVQFLGREDPLEKGQATHSSVSAWRIPWTIHWVAKSRTRLSNFHFTSARAIIKSGIDKSLVEVNGIIF